MEYGVVPELVRRCVCFFITFPWRKIAEPTPCCWRAVLARPFSLSGGNIEQCLRTSGGCSFYCGFNGHLVRPFSSPIPSGIIAYSASRNHVLGASCHPLPPTTGEAEQCLRHQNGYFLLPNSGLTLELHVRSSILPCEYYLTCFSPSAATMSKDRPLSRIPVWRATALSPAIMFHIHKALQSFFTSFACLSVRLLCSLGFELCNRPSSQSLEIPSS